MKLTRIHVNLRLVSLLFCVTLLLTSLLLFSSAVAAPPPDDPGEVKLSAQDDGRQIELKEGQVLVVSLESNPSTGYMWEVEEADKLLLRQVGEMEFEPESSPPSAQGEWALVGAPEKQMLRFEAVGAGQSALRLVYRRPWEKEVEPIRTFSLQVQGVGTFTHVKSPAATPTPIVGPLAEGLIVVADLPSSFNWCELGGCTPIKDQEGCGSCWAFSTVGVLESGIKIKDGVTKDLSEQYLVSCNTDGWSCSGGLWAHDYHRSKIPPGESAAGAVYEADFPYVARDDPCGLSHSHHEKIVSWAFVGGQSSVPSVAAIKQAIYDHGPVSAGVCVGNAFRVYGGGVFQTNECGNVNHAIVLVGWDDVQGVWYLRNSWGEGWGEERDPSRPGEKGYMRIKYGTSSVGYGANYIVYNGSGCPDTYESDNAYTSAQWIAVNGAAQTHNFHVAGDVDWVQFTMTAGRAYTITTSNLGGNTDTVLTLYDTNGTAVLASNDNCGAGPASCINNWISSGSGTYFVRVSNVSGAGGCTGYDYNLAVVDDSGGGGKSTTVFLPLIMKSSCGGGDITNGSFESGRTCWIEYSTHGWSLILPASSLRVTPHSGSWATWLGGDDDEISYIEQQVTVPAGSPYLAYWHWIASQDSCGYDFGGVIVDGSVVDVYDLCTNTGGWVKHVVNLSAYAGRPVALQIRAETDSWLNSNLFIDDVSFQADASSIMQNTPTILDLKDAVPKSDKTTPQVSGKGTEPAPAFLLRP